MKYRVHYHIKLIMSASCQRRSSCRTAWPPDLRNTQKTHV